MGQETGRHSFDYGLGGTYAPDLYRCHRLAETIDGFSNIIQQDYQSYGQLGYLAIENAFSTAEVTEAREALSDLVMGKHPEFTGIMFETSAKDILPDLNAEEREAYVRKLMGFNTVEERLRRIAEHPALIRILTDLLGEPPAMFQDMALLKPPHIGREKPWHQDHAYFDYPLGTKIVGVWIALDAATTENGCMYVLEGGHRDGPRTHFNRRDWQICDSDIIGNSAVAVPLMPGGCLLFDGLLPHGTPANTSGTRRRAVQFHYAPASAMKTSEEDRMALFGEGGKDVTC